MADLASLIQTFTNQSMQPSTPDMPWQQQLLKEVDPESARRRNIATALQKASAALATTPGDFLTGLSSAASVGAGSYLEGREANDMKRMQAMQAIQQANATQRERDLSRLKDAIGIQSGYEKNQYDRERDRVADSQWQAGHDRSIANDKATQDYRDRSLQSLTQYRTDRVAIDRHKQTIKTQAGGNVEAERRLRLNAVYDNLQEFQKSLGQASTPEDQESQRIQVDAKRKELEAAYGIDTRTGQFTDQPVPEVKNPATIKTPGAPGKADKGSAKPSPVDALQQARDAIAQGADPQAVRQRLIENGYDASGL
jgi:hypothetical protein